MIKPKMWTGQPLEGVWLFTRKLDGVRMLRCEEGTPVSRRGKPLHNLEEIPPYITDAEIFLGSWKETVSAVRTQEGEPVQGEFAYSLDPLDRRLILFSVNNPSAEYILDQLQIAITRGDEGLVLYQGEQTAFKVKPKENYDVPVLGATEGKGKYLGMVGALITPMGNVSGMTDAQRAAFTDRLPEVIEVECMGLTEKGNFRHPRFLRERFDKPIEDCDV